jgi:D-alanine-D-alanine ligase
MADRTLDVTVLAGGPSREREVSLCSGRAVATALSQAGYNVRLADIGPDNLAVLDQPTDVFFIALHGNFGEDGELQKIMEERGLTYCGSGPTACRLAADKHETKVLFVKNGIPTPRFAVAGTVNEIRSAVGCWTLPVVVKPVSEGSSIGTTIVRESALLRETIEKCFSSFGSVLVEDFIEGKELTVGILGGKALPMIEIRPAVQFYDYQAKYDRDDTEYLFDLGMDRQTYERVQCLAERSAEVLGMREFCRVDVMLDQNGNPYFLEVNAIPGFTEHSLLPKAAHKIGLDMAGLCSHIIELTMARASGELMTSGKVAR